MENLGVQCPRCCGTYHTTTDQYDPDKIPTGSMFALKDEFKHLTTFPWNSKWDKLTCPSCQMPYCDNDKKIRRIQPIKKEPIQEKKEPEKLSKCNIQCVSCCGTFHETTDKFDKSKPANGSMLTLKKEFKNRAWEAFPEYTSTDFPDLVCPSCGMQYCDSKGNIYRAQEMKEEDVETVEIVMPETKEEVVTITKEDIILPDEKPPKSKKPVYVNGKTPCPNCSKPLTKQWYKRHTEKCK